MKLQYRGETGWTKGVGHLVKNGLYEAVFFPKVIKEEWLNSKKLIEYKKLEKK